VDPHLNVPGDFPTIQAAVDAAQEGDTIAVAPGQYTENVVVRHKIVLLGDSTSPSVIIRPAFSGSAPISFFDVDDRGAQLIGFVVEQAIGAPGVLCSASSPSIRWNHIRDNDGSGIFLHGSGIALICDNAIYRNESHAGAGILMDGSAADVFRNEIYANRAWIGGGIMSREQTGVNSRLSAGGEPAYVIAENVFTGNYAGGGGGGIYLYEGYPILIQHNLFVDDTAGFGGGIDNSARKFATVTENTFDRCVAGENDGAGNAIWWAHGAHDGGVIKNNVISNTKSTAEWGGALGGDAGAVANTIVNYNTFWNNQLADLYSFSAGPNTQNADPSYCNPTALNYSLDADSPCAGTGEGGTDRGAFGVGCGLR
jgi:hypothetical protein